MAIGRTVHWIGVFFVVVAALLLLITSVGAPTVHDIGLLKVTLNNASDIRRSSVVFGPFGYCVLDVAPAQTDQDYCSHVSIGYIPAQEMRLLDAATKWTTWKGHDLDLMTVAYILFPIACAIAFLAAAFAFCGVIGSLIASVLCATAFVVTLPVMIVAFVSMGYLKSHVQAAGLSAHYGVGMWTCLAAFILLFFAMLLLFFSCCSGLRGKHRDKKHYNEKGLKHREDSERSLNHPRSNDNHHYGRDAAIGGAGIGAYESERHHRDHDTNGFEHHGRRHAPANAAAARAAEGVGGQHRVGGSNRGNDYDTVLADQDRQNLGHNGSHHYGRDAAIGGGALGAAGAGLGAHEYERSRATPEAAGAAIPAPREHKLRDTMRDSSNRGYEEPLAAGANQRYASQGRGVNAPAHHLTTNEREGSRFPEHQSVTHHHPTTTTTTSTYADDRGVHNNGLHTTSYDPTTGNTRHYVPGSAI